MLRHQTCIWFYLKPSVTMMTERVCGAPVISREAKASQPSGKRARALWWAAVYASKKPAPLGVCCPFDLGETESIRVGNFPFEGHTVGFEFWLWHLLAERPWAWYLNLCASVSSCVQMRLQRSLSCRFVGGLNRTLYMRPLEWSGS